MRRFFCENFCGISNLFRPPPEVQIGNRILIDERELWKKISSGDAQTLDAWCRGPSGRVP